MIVPDGTSRPQKRHFFVRPEWTCDEHPHRVLWPCHEHQAVLLSEYRDNRPALREHMQACRDKAIEDGVTPEQAQAQLVDWLPPDARFFVWSDGSK